ncbi:MAG: CBS domain-containing protein [Myxococcales bacterium]|nr:CBS domain-containing protein [Myxococcales bacterium]
MAVTAGEVMTDSVISVSPEATLLEVLRLFVEERIHGAPVVGEDGRLQGVITTMDLMRAQENADEAVITSNDYLRELLEFSVPDWPADLVDFQDRLSDRTVSEFMTKQVVAVPREASVAAVARCLREHKIHRVWVEHNGRLCGVISTLDMMALIE